MFKRYRSHANEPHANTIVVQPYDLSGKWIDSSMPYESSSSSSSNEFESSSMESDTSSSTSSSEPIADSSNESTLEIAVICGSVLLLLFVIVGFCLFRQHRSRIFRRRADSLYRCLVEQSSVESESVHPALISSYPQHIPNNAASVIHVPNQSVDQSIEQSIKTPATPSFSHHNHPSSSLPTASTAASLIQSFDVPEQRRYVSFPHSNSHGSTFHVSSLYNSQNLHQQSSNHSQPPASKTQQSFFLARPVASSTESSTGSGPNQMNYRFTMSTRVTGSAPDVDSCYEQDDDLSDTDSMEGEDLICSTEKVDESELISHSASSVQFVS